MNKIKRETTEVFLMGYTKKVCKEESLKTYYKTTKKLIVWLIKYNFEI